MKPRRREYCTCVEVRNYDPDEAAARLKCRVRFLTDNLGKLPHQKIGQSVAFCNCELALIQAMYSVLPPDVPADTVGEEPHQHRPAQMAPETVRSLQSIRPAGRRNRAVAP